MPMFEHSLALEMLDFFNEDVAEMREAFAEKRPIEWPTAKL